MDIVTLSKAKKYTDSSIAGIDGVLAGKNCKIQSVEDITNGHRITFSWNDDEDVARTVSIDVMDGRDIISTEIKYASSSSGTTPPSSESDWSTNVPLVPDGYYLWTRNITTFSTGDQTISYVIGRQGVNGVSPTVTVTDIPGGHRVVITDGTGQHPFNVMDGLAIDHIEVAYAASSSGTSAPTNPSDWQSTPPEVPTGNYLWTRNKTYLKDGTTSVAYLVGLQGAEGISPTVEVTPVPVGNQVTITDKDGDHTFTVEDGQDGADGRDGADGDDGFSPIITTNKVGKTTTITIVDATGTKYATVLDGADGKTITNITINAQNHVIVSYSDGTSSDAGELVVQSAVMSVNGETGNVILSLPDVVNVGSNLTYDSVTNTLSANAQSITVDSEISSTSENPVQNKVIKSALDNKVESGLPTDAILHYSFDDVPDIPDGDNVVLNNKDFSLTDWVRLDGFTSVTLDSENRLKVSPDASYYYTFKKDGLTYGDVKGKLLIAKVFPRSSISGIKFGLYSYSTDYYSSSPLKLDKWQVIEVYIQEFQDVPDSSPVWFYGDMNGNGSNYILIEWLYIGDGSSITPIIDNSGNGDNAINNGAVAVPGICGKAVRLYDKVIETEYKLAGDFSISLWVKPDSVVSNKTRYIVRSILPESYYGGIYVYIKNGSNNHYFSIEFQVTLYSCTLYQSDLLPLNTWTHIVLTNEEGTFKAYINGNLVNTHTYSNYRFSNSYPIGLGSTSNDETQAIDDFQVFDYAIDQKAVTALYTNRGNTPKYYTLADYLINNGSEDAGKADKVHNATNGNLAGLDGTGNLTDSGKKPSDFVEKSSTSGLLKNDGTVDTNTYITSSNLATVATSGDFNDLINKPTIDSAMSSTSTNAVQNKVVNTALEGKVPTTRTVNGKVLSSDITLSASDVSAIASSLKGAANGVAELDVNGLVPSSQLPSYVDDVLEYNSLSAFPETGQSGKIYVALDTNLTYRWSGSAYVEISPSLALGETSSTAYRGDRGKTAYDHSQLTSGNPHNVTKSDVGLGSVVDTGDSAIPVSGGTTKFTTGGAYTELAKKLSLSGGTMTGTINEPVNKVQINFRPNHANYDAVVSYQTSGNEALVLSTKNAVTSFMFVNGEDTVANISSNRWQSLTPGLQIKNNCVSINKLIANSVSPSYTLDVGGTINASGNISTNGSVTIGNNKATMQYNSTTQAIDFVFN